MTPVHRTPYYAAIARIGTGILMVCALSMSLSAAADDATELAHNDHRLDDLSDVWINEVGSLLDIDRDRDGWFSRFVISIDADVYSDRHRDNAFLFADEASVYVRLSLTDSSGVENLLYDSDVFDVYGTSGGDRHRIELDLRGAYPEDRYDMVVELRDAFNDQLLDVVDAGDFRTLDDLPLEDARRDGRIGNDDTVQDVVAFEYAGGGTGPWLLLLGALSIVGRACSLRARI